MTPETLLPSSWKECRLGDVVDYGATQKAEPNEIPADAWVLELEDIERDTSKVLQRVTFAQRQSKSTKNRFAVGDVLYGKLRPYLNKVVRADQDGYCTTEIVPLKPSKAIDGGYLFYWLKHPVFLEYVTSVAHGLNMPRLGTEAGKEAPFVLSPLNEQKRIADKLDAVLARVDACRERLDRVPAILKRFRQAVLDAATSGQLTEEWREDNQVTETATELIRRIAEERKHLGLPSAARVIRDEGIEVPETRLPSSWTWCRVGEIADVRLGGTPSRKVSRYWGGEISWVSSGEVANCRITRTAEQITRAGLENSNAKLYPQGSVLIAMIGEGKTRGQAAILDIDASTNQNVAGLVFTAGDIDGSYVWLWALGEYERNRDVGRGGNQPALNGAKVRALPVPLPPLEEQAEIIRRVEALFAYAHRLEARYTAARALVERLTPALLTKAFRGELVPQDPNDEPAAALLERIRAVRVEQPTAKRRRKSPTERVPHAPRKKAAMTKSRYDDDVLYKPYLAGLLREAGGIASVEDLFRRAELPVTDFYKQLAWEVENDHIRDDDTRLEAA